MEIKQIKELMAAMERCGTTKVQIKKGSFEINLERSPENLNQEFSQRVNYHHDDYSDEGRSKFSGQPRNAPLPRTSDMAAALHSVEEKTTKEAPGQFITSPMVGTFYPTPSPDEPDYVKVGDFIEKGQLVCIIEAMKVMNEIKAPISGTLVEILVESGHPVEFGAKIFRIQ